MTETWPDGVRFLPMDDVLITDYLSNKIQGKPLPLEGAILEAEVYGQHAGPWQLFQYPDEYWQTRVDSSGKLITNESVRYVFTRLTRVGKGTGNKQWNRAAGGGCWHDNKSEAVEDKNDDKVGYKITFKFKGGNIKGGNNVNVPSDIVYIMNEYSTLSCHEYVVCKIKQIRRYKRRRGVHNIDELAKRSRSDHHTNHVYPIVQESYVQESGSLIQAESIIDHQEEDSHNDEDQLMEDELQTYLMDNLEID